MATFFNEAVDQLGKLVSRRGHVEPAPAAPFCTALHTSFCVDPDKTVRPCCTFEGVMGNLNESSLEEIRGSALWADVKAQIVRGETPTGCASCYKREKATGWSVRMTHFDPAKPENANWNKGITQIELNTTNICNLACTHCSSHFSSRWVELNGGVGKDFPYHHTGRTVSVQAPNPESLVRQLAALDLSHLEIVRFKGGEPMLNRDVPAALEFLRDRGLLPNVSIDFVSNGSIINERVLNLLRECRDVRMCLSVDGVGALQTYIRRGPSENERIEAFFEAFAALERIRFSASVSVMVYNVFHLDRITEWWNGISAGYPGKFSRMGYGLTVSHPARLSVSVLQDPTRQDLIRKYREAKDADYTCVIHALEQPFGGARLHNDFVTYTQDMDRMWKSNILDVVPELAAEMVLLEEQSSEAALIAGMALGRAQKYSEALALYDRFLASDYAQDGTVWQVRLHRAIVLGQLQQWESSLSVIKGIASLQPAMVVQLLEADPQDESTPYSEAPVMRLLSEELPAYRLLMAGLAHMALKDSKTASDRFGTAQKLDPAFALATLAQRELAVVA